MEYKQHKEINSNVSTETATSNFWNKPIVIIVIVVVSLMVLANIDSNENKSKKKK